MPKANHPATLSRALLGTAATGLTTLLLAAVAGTLFGQSLARDLVGEETAQPRARVTR